MPPATNPLALEIAGLSKRFSLDKRQVTALDGISARTKAGLVTGLIGPDGAGKTTLMRLIAGLLRADAGAIRVFGVDVGASPLAVQGMLSYMPQRFGLYEDLTVSENLTLYADLQGVPRAQRAAQFATLLEMTGMARFTSRLAGKLSGGMKQKLGLACTLIRAPRLLLLDEPTVGVDPVSRRELWHIVDHLVRGSGMSVLVSTAYLDEAERCDEVLLLHEGRLIGEGQPGNFTAAMAGRSFLVRTPALSKRAAQALLAAQPGVADALIQGEAVRLVMASARAPDFVGVPRLGEASIVPVAPRFEDRFVDLLKQTAPTPATAPAPRAAASEPGTRVIEVEHLSKLFGAFRAVDDISFTVRRGEIFGLLGANGAGKSTTFRMLCGLLPASEGTLRVAGFDLRRAAAPARARLGYMAQKFSLYGDLSVLQNLRFFSAAYRLSGARQAARIGWALEEFELRQVQGATARDLPLGFKQRLALACALMHEPDILFLDEPTSGVDPLARREFWQRINALAEAGVTVLVTTHFMDEAEYCDHLVIMAQGRILAAGSSEELKQAASGPAAPDPTMEDAFIALIEADTRRGAAA
ncbi:ATP-binding cassette domain-containing protein [Acidocella sp. MX-AZ02]|uniref:ATP-binding cassette domain-containing protein n=1 Tax=Acidocella sp. MX-AZ02 TaxID=1214225 RepID=UPI00028E425F|nr:ATP-binding cassette domain-containing protein [Acidocella sp. MX-AZ02]EKM98164.1 ABC transporter-like protein [Acidocella sp. MX-AZ02]